MNTDFLKQQFRPKGAVPTDAEKLAIVNRWDPDTKALVIKCVCYIAGKCFDPHRFATVSEFQEANDAGIEEKYRNTRSKQRTRLLLNEFLPPLLIHAKKLSWFDLHMLLFNDLKPIYQSMSMSVDFFKHHKFRFIYTTDSGLHGHVVGIVENLEQWFVKGNYNFEPNEVVHGLILDLPKGRSILRKIVIEPNNKVSLVDRSPAVVAKLAGAYMALFNMLPEQISGIEGGKEIARPKFESVSDISTMENQFDRITRLWNRIVKIPQSETNTGRRTAQPIVPDAHWRDLH